MFCFGVGKTYSVFSWFGVILVGKGAFCSGGFAILVVAGSKWMDSLCFSLIRIGESTGDTVTSLPLLGVGRDGHQLMSLRAMRFVGNDHDREKL